MNSSLYTGVLGLQNHQIRMDVIGNNIANINTYGFKRGRATFADLLSRTYFAAASPQNGRGGINPLQVGMGMTTNAVTNIMTQGQIESTGRLTDVAINGNGWFVLKDGSGDTVYTRDGTFGLDKEGTLVTANGWKIQGWTRVETTHDHDFTVDTSRPTTDINFQIGEKLEAEATNKVGLKCNLKSDSRSIIADGLDPNEGYATKDDTLVDLYKVDANEFTPEHLELREGDWIEVKAQVSYYDGTSTGNTVTGTGDGSQDYSLISSSSLPVEITQVTISDGAGNINTYNAGNLVFTDPDVDNDGTYDLAAGEWVYDSGTGQIIVGSDFAAANNIEITYNILNTCDNTLPWQQEKYYYFQITNDTDIADLETAIQNTLDALDVNGTINAEVVYDTDDAQFNIYNNTVTGSQDWNSIKVDINSVSGSAIRRGYILQDSTDKSVKGTRLSLVNGGLGGNMDDEIVGYIDYQTDAVELDYNEVDSSEQIYAEVVNTRLALTGYDSTTGNDVTLADWDSGYRGAANDLAMVNRTDVLSVNGTVWSRVDYFSGAANEYVISDDAAGAPVIFFNTEGSLEPGTTDEIILQYRPSNAQRIELRNASSTTTGEYTIDSTTGNISLVWSGTSSDPQRAIVASDAAGNALALTGTIRISAQYTTEKRLMDAPETIMDNRWADFVQAYAEVTEGGDGKARTNFNNHWGDINNKSTASPSGLIYDQATSSQPTEKVSNRFLSAETHRTSLTVYDSLGDTHELQYIFTHVGSYYDTSLQERYTNMWFWRAELPYEDVMAFDSMDRIDAVADGIARLGGQLEFDDNGLLRTTKLAGNTGPIMFDPSPIGMNGNTTYAVDTLSIESDFLGTSGEEIDGVTQYASDFTTLAYEQNGWAMGTLQTFAIDQTGIIEGRYSNNIVKPIGQLSLAVFPNEEGLTKEGNNVFSLSANSGTPTIVPAFVAGAGSILGGSLEMSNVDIAQEFTNMIITERGFQANSRIVTTSDEMLTEVINLKR